MRTFGTAFVFFVYLTLLTIPVKADKVNNDYFTTSRDDNLLNNVERYHLGTENFWKAYLAGGNQYAISHLEFVLRYFPNHPEALDLLGHIAKLTKTPSLPISHYHKALRLFPQHAFTHAQYGNYLAENSVNNVQIKEGIANLKKAIEMNPKLAVAYAWLANAYYKTGNSELALQSAKKAKKLNYQDEMLDKVLKNNTN
jgi:Tfp pilus assembly protein PilF